MGCIPHFKFKIDDSVIGQGKYSAELFRKLGLTVAEIDSFYSLFRQKDMEGTGYIRGDVFLTSIHRHLSHFYTIVFRMFDNEGDLQLNFLEFVCSVKLF